MIEEYYWESQLFNPPPPKKNEKGEKKQKQKHNPELDMEAWVQHSTA